MVWVSVGRKLQGRKTNTKDYVNFYSAVWEPNIVAVSEIYRQIYITMV